IDTAFAAENNVITHVPSSTDTPRLPEIVGIATFAIDESSTFMNVASATASVASTSFPPASGGGLAEFVEVSIGRFLAFDGLWFRSNNLICQIYGLKKIALRRRVRFSSPVAPDHAAPLYLPSPLARDGPALRRRMRFAPALPCSAR